VGTDCVIDLLHYLLDRDTARFFACLRFHP
jgi:hypothetical protein